MKYLRYLFLFLFSVIWLAGCNRVIMQKLGQWRILPDEYLYGDLYRLSNLPYFKDLRSDCEAYTPPQVPPGSKKIHLYIIGDSFTEAQRVGADDFPVDRYQYVHWSDYLHLRLDTTARNILLLESVERHFRQILAQPVTSLVPDTATFVVPPPGDPRLMPKIDNAFSALQTEDRLESLLFKYSPILALKEWKAAFTYAFFRRTSDKVTISEDGQDIVYYLDTDTTLINSSFKTLLDSEVDLLVENLQVSVDLFRKMGFDQVLLSIIPNKTSVLMPTYGRYNGLIERVYAHPRLPVPYVDVLHDFRQLGQQSYLRGDSHWTCPAQYLWLDKVNALILADATP
ncbi:hypothetical protein GCM10027275_14480 [Rhabdobacter roseus]|uniref:AlgX/AlgJ SGNH hydrolase-like domain-containing protein n=1 Tax=Rhabdobacter roseus TaxID=1655419 RepID=A0A840TNN6_9BACT|nr:hypothetical protein [Rhabdobacter roseus]MBB5283367.1 hypothetical protein [Rhabdobacter roseus]